MLRPNAELGFGLSSGSCLFWSTCLFSMFCFVIYLNLDVTIDVARTVCLHRWYVSCRISQQGFSTVCTGTLSHAGAQARRSSTGGKHEFLGIAVFGIELGLGDDGCAGCRQG